MAGPRAARAPTRASAGSPAEARFDAATAWVWRRLPGAARRRVPQTLVGFVAINGVTFALDLVLLAVLDEQPGVPHAAAITVAYGAAFAVAFVLNRWLNFRSHGRVGEQVGRYVVVVVVNYLALVLGLGAGLASVGVPLLLARVLAGVAEAVWMYSAMRWWVFRNPEPA